MPKLTVKLPALKPRNAVIRALLIRFSTGAGQHRQKAEKRQQGVDARDLAQRVRDSGEW